MQDGSRGIGLKSQLLILGTTLTLAVSPVPSIAAMEPARVKW